MLRPYLLILLAVLVTSCGAALPSAAQPPEPVPSAAQPAITGGGSRTYALRTLDGLRQVLAKLGPVRALDQIPKEGIRLSEQGARAGCVAASGDMTILLCHFGPEGGRPIAQGILWHDGRGWRSQLYPQARARVAAERAAFLAETGCQAGCQGRFRQGRLYRSDEGAELLVVVDTSSADGHPAEEVHVLRLADDEWTVLWVPDAGDWNYGHATVILGKGTHQFTVRSSSWLRQDHLSGYLSEPAEGDHRWFAERWMRKGDGYVLRDRREEPTPFGALVRLVYYASTGADEKAQRFLGPGVGWERMRPVLAQRPRRQGWKATRQGEQRYVVQPGNGRPMVILEFDQHGGGWLVTEAKVGQ